MENHNELALLLGSNTGNSAVILNKGIELISLAIGKISQTSSIYKSPAWGFDGHDFLNQVVLVETHLSSLDCLSLTQKIEKQLGRKKKSKNGIYENRLIDIDILFYNKEIIHYENLHIPHPRIAERRFTLEPLNELMPDFIHPQNNKKINQLILECTDNSKVKKWNG